MHPRYPIFHIPHDGRLFPEELMASVCIPREDFLRYHRLMRDTDIIRAVPEAYRGSDMCQAFSVSRLLCDVERFLGPEEIMEQYGMGFCYEKACDGTTIKRVTPELRQKTLAYYTAHHARMDRLCETHPRILFIDLHSYSDEILPPGFRQSAAPTPDLCIGTDPRYTPLRLAATVKKRFTAAGFTAAVNDPYAGCYIPNAVLHGRSNCDCVSIMLEFHKRTYCDRPGRSVPEKLKAIRRVIWQVIAACLDDI